MGQKVNPIGLRLGISRTWNSKWFAEKDYAIQLRQDLDIQKFVKARLKHAAISKGIHVFQGKLWGKKLIQ